MVNELMLQTGIDVPFEDIQLIIHQPKCKDIAMIGEEIFFIGCELMGFSKNSLTSKDKINLSNKSNFDIIMSIINDKSVETQKQRLGFLMILNLILPEYEIKIQSNCIMFLKEKEPPHILSSANFDEFQSIIKQMFCIGTNSEQITFNPEGELAAKIAEKIKRGRAKVAKQKGKDVGKISIISRYISILAVGEQKNQNELKELTIYQLFDEYERFTLKQQNDMYIQAKMVGATGMQEVDNWTKDLHE